MRSIGQIQDEGYAYTFVDFLRREGIDCRYEWKDQEKEASFEIWVFDEDDIEKATHWLERYRHHPENPLFAPITASSEAECKENLQPTSRVGQEKIVSSLQRFLPRLDKIARAKGPLTRFLISLCVILYLSALLQTSSFTPPYRRVQSLLFTPTFLALSYDLPRTLFPHSHLTQSHEVDDSPEDQGDEAHHGENKWQDFHQHPTWIGLYRAILYQVPLKVLFSAPMFEKIAQGQLWRLFSPALLHGGLLHLLFNMMWLWMLGSQIERRIGGWRYCLLTLSIGVISNTCQYLMGGPIFIGYSGVVCGLAGFVGTRQIRAPWEGYLLSRSSFIVLFVFVAVMVCLQILSFILIRFQLSDFTVYIANSAHLSGAVVGIGLGRISFFAK